MLQTDPNQTAQGIAMQLLLLSYHPRWGKLVPEEIVSTTRDLLNTTPSGEQMVKMINKQFFRRCFRFLEQCTLPGFGIHVALRKRWIEQQVFKAIQSGIKQILILGAGLDTLAYRLHLQFPQITWIELDHPATLQYQQKFLAESKRWQKNLHLHPIDFTKHTFSEYLTSTDLYHPDQPALFVAEGLLMYVHPHDVRYLFEVIRKQSGKDSLFVGTALQSDPPVYQKRTKFTHWQAEWIGAAYRWKISIYQLADFLKISHLQLLQTHYSEELIPQDLKHLTLPKDEYLFLAKITIH